MTVVISRLIGVQELEPAELQRLSGGIIVGTMVMAVAIGVSLGLFHIYYEADEKQAS